jgi:cell division protein FtsN
VLVAERWWYKPARAVSSSNHSFKAEERKRDEDETPSDEQQQCLLNDKAEEQEQHAAQQRQVRKGEGDVGPCVDFSRVNWIRKSFTAPCSWDLSSNLDEAPRTEQGQQNEQGENERCHLPIL